MKNQNALMLVRDVYYQTKSVEYIVNCQKHGISFALGFLR